MDGQRKPGRSSVASKVVIVVLIVLVATFVVLHLAGRVGPRGHRPPFPHSAPASLTGR